MSRIPLHDLTEQNNSIRDEINAAVKSVLDSNHYLNGQQVAQFEDSFAKFCGVKHCVGVGNATDGFEIAFQALNLEREAEVIIPSNAHVSPALAAVKVGLKPVFCDVDERRMLLNASTVSAQITEKTKAIVAVHLYGQVCPILELKQLCAEHNLILIEDFSQAHGASHNFEKVGSLGHIGVCSFYPTKPLGALGDGGAILTSIPELAARCRQFSNYGWLPRNNAAVIGQNSRLDEIQAAVLNVKLQYLEQWNTKRFGAAQLLVKKLSAVSILKTPELKNGDVCHLFVVRSKSRVKLQENLVESGFDSLVHYPIPIHKQQVFEAARELPVSEMLSDQVLSVPLNQKVGETIVKLLAD